MWPVKEKKTKKIMKTSRKLVWTLCRGNACHVSTVEDLPKDLGSAILTLLMHWNCAIPIVQSIEWLDFRFDLSRLDNRPKVDSYNNGISRLHRLTNIAHGRRQSTVTYITLCLGNKLHHLMADWFKLRLHVQPLRLFKCHFLGGSDSPNYFLFVY